jgi:uncharacterized protein (DUF2141 family)
MTASIARLLAALTITTAALAMQPASAQDAAAQPAAPAADPAAEAPRTASLTLTFTGIKTPTGAVMVGLYDSPAAYDSGKAARKVMIVVSGDTASQVLEDLPPGTYAIKAFHDVDGDGKLAANAFGIPSEPYAFSNDARGAMGPAKWAAAAFEVKAGDNAQTIHID